MNLLSPQPDEKITRMCRPCAHIRRAVGWLWRKIVDRDPDQKARRRKSRIDNMMHDVVLMEAMRRWELESKDQEVSKDGK
jgi:hypothetical protein